MRKWLLVLAGVGLAVAVIVPGALQLYAYRQKVVQKLAGGRLIDRQRFGRIRPGMTHAEVEAVLGGPPGDYTTKDVAYLDPLPGAGTAGERAEYWQGNGRCLEVLFNDAAGTVLRAGFKEPIPSGEPSLPERARRWVRQLWP